MANIELVGGDNIEPKKSPKQMGRDTIAGFLNAYASTGLMHEDFMSLKPKERLIFAEKLLQYQIPKFQAVTYDVAVSESKISIEQRLKQLCGE